MQIALAGNPLGPAALARRQLGRLLLLLAVPILMLAPPAAGAAELSLRGISPAGAPPAPDYPVPNDPGMVLYMQRSTNPNTVVYAAQFASDGTLHSKDPIKAYWRRYNASGEVKDLSGIERRMAYGVTTSPRGDGSFDFRFRAIPEIPLVLEQRGAGQAVLTFAPQGQPVDLTYGFLEVSDGGLLPSVTGVRLFGERRSDGQPVQVTYSVQRGQITSGPDR